MSLALVLAVTRSVDRSAAGVVFTVTSAFLLVESVVRLGTDAGIVHFIATAKAKDRREDIADVIVASLVPVLAASVLGAGLAPLVSRGVLDSLGTLPAGVHTRAMVAIVALAVPVAALHDFASAATRGLGTSRPTVVVERILRPALQLVGVIVAVVGHAAALGLVAAWLAPYAVVAPITCLWLLRLLRAQQIPLRTSGWINRFGAVWRFTLPRSFAGIAQILLQRLDIVLVGAFLGGAAAAVYTGATRFVVVGQLGNQAMTYSFQPQLARLIGRGEMGPARLLFRTSTAWIVGLTAPLYLAVCATSPLLVRLLGHHYRSGLPALVIVTLAMLVANACGMVDMVLITMGRTTWNLANTALGLGINVVLDVILIPTVGITGAAIGWAAAILATNVVPLVQIYRSFAFSPLSAMWVRLVTVAVIGFGVVPAVLLLAIGPQLAAMVVLLAVVYAVYIGYIWRWRDELGVATLLRARAST